MIQYEMNGSMYFITQPPSISKSPCAPQDNLSTEQLKNELWTLWQFEERLITRVFWVETALRGAALPEINSSGPYLFDVFLSYVLTHRTLEICRRNVGVWLITMRGIHSFHYCWSTEARTRCLALFFFSFSFLSAKERIPRVSIHIYTAPMFNLPTLGAVIKIPGLFGEVSKDNQMITVSVDGSFFWPITLRPTREGGY